ncbi:unnamed protein product [Penicillium roqueforti FM164]|uniref:Uncharacterized protein n=1 Tax=Penicillium roqueforti (strain FM164) TaxID=1365484 RepID=W6QRL3_PENRF|nr:unnamed protein product [Penicillium roqueforti FM164]
MKSLKVIPKKIQLLNVIVPPCLEKYMELSLVWAHEVTSLGPICRFFNEMGLAKRGRPSRS